MPRASRSTARRCRSRKIWSILEPGMAVTVEIKTGIAPHHQLSAVAARQIRPRELSRTMIAWADGYRPNHVSWESH